MTDPGQVSKGFADAARDTVNAVGKLAQDTSKQVDTNCYTLGAALKSITKAANVAVTSGLRFADATLAVRPTDGQMLVADNMATVARRMVNQAKRVVEEASGRMDDNSYTVNSFVKSMTKLADIGLVGGIELVETAFIGPGRYAPAAFISDPITVPESHDVRVLSIDEAAPLKRPATADADAVPTDRICFEPPYLTRGVTEFRIVVNEEGLPSGIYTGKVRVGDDEEPVEVVIRL
jgi:hypothetical protein